jgi:hypothetical protein
MQKKNDYFEYAKMLSNQYSTYLTNEDVKRKILNIFDGEPPIDQYNSGLSHREFVNSFLLHHYPNETSIKSTFINKILFKTTNHVSIFELNVGKSRLDLCKINGNSTAFEIKTELDTHKRLRQQMEDYFQVFEKVYLICSVNNLENMLPHLPEECGIYTYHTTKKGKYIFKKNRKAIKSNNISPIAQLSVLTKKDLNIFFNSQVLLNKDEMINDIISRYTENEINKIFKSCLKYKYYSKWNFLVKNSTDILEIDYQWFFKTQLSPEIVYL